MVKRYNKKDASGVVVKSANCAVADTSSKKPMRKVMAYFKPISFSASAGANAIDSVISKRRKKA